MFFIGDSCTLCYLQYEYYHRQHPELTLVLTKMGTVTDLFISKKSEPRRRFKIKGITKVDLNNFEEGIYNAQINSCNIGGNIKLNITK